MAPGRAGGTSNADATCGRGGLAGIPAGRAALSETAAKEALAAFGVPVVHDALVHSEAEATAAAAKRIGFPLVAKLVSPDVAHKTEHGLIRLGLKIADAVGAAYDAMVAKAQSMPGVRIEGVTLEPMLTGGVEILAGVTRDPVFGWMLTVGLGGVWTELMKDVRHRLLPVDAAGAEEMLRGLEGFQAARRLSRRAEGGCGGGGATPSRLCAMRCWPVASGCAKLRSIRCSSCRKGRVPLQWMRWCCLIVAGGTAVEEAA